MNFATATELRDIALIADAIEELDKRLRTRNAQVSFGEIPLFDSNGESLGHLKYDGAWVFVPSSA